MHGSFSKMIDDDFPRAIRILLIIYDFSLSPLKPWGSGQIIFGLSYTHTPRQWKHTQ